MKLVKIHNIKSLSYSLLCMIFIPLNIEIYSFTLTKNKKVICISSSQEIINLMKNNIIFLGRVNVKCNLFNIYADKVILIYKNYKNENEIIKCYGKPVRFCKFKEDNSIFFRCRSQIIFYDISNNLIKFLGDVCLEQDKNIIKSNSIIYKINNEKLIKNKL